MTRLEFEMDILRVMRSVDNNDNSTAETPLRTHIQNKINSVHAGIVSDRKWGWRRKPFGAVLAAPVVGTITWTQGAFTGVVVGQIPANDWIGGQVMLSGNGFPLRVAGFSGSTLTFTEPIMAASGTAVTFTMYFSAVVVPVDCQSIEERTMKLSGHRLLDYRSRQAFERRQGYYRTDSDYGFSESTSSVISAVDIGQPVVYTSYENIVISGVNRMLVSVYPFPDQIFALAWSGWKKPTDLTADASVPDLPEQYHKSVMLPRLKVEMCGYPGFELSATEKKTESETYLENLERMVNDSRQDESDLEPYRPVAALR